mmetsp:Transcript_15324/g.30919  ORF Transcript_15324/g.30919 Transcript_15324/m.30919 type:complete len:295 (+) Transcript_15324:71-955(+)
MATRCCHLSVLAVLLAALSTSENGLVTGFIAEKNFANHHRRRQTKCSAVPPSAAISPPSSRGKGKGSRRSNAPSPLFYRNGNDPIRGNNQSLVETINSPQEFAAFLDTSTSSSRRMSSDNDSSNPITDLRVVKVYASWCLSCKSFDVRYRKLANQHRAPDSDLYSGFPSVRYAEIEFGANEDLCRSLGAIKLPFVLMYRPGDRYDEAREAFVCPPRSFDMVVDAVERYTSTGTTITSAGSSKDKKKLIVEEEPTPEEWDDQMELGRSLVYGIAMKLQEREASSGTAGDDADPCT